MGHLKEKVGNLAIIVFILIPVVLWLNASPLSLRFVSLTQTLTSIGQILGLEGLALFCLVAVLKSRLSFLEKLCGGMNKVYFSHHSLGGIAFILVLFHPLFLLVKYLIVSTREAALLLLGATDVFVLFGVISLLLMFVLLSLTFYIKLPYDKWKVTHAFLDLFFLSAIVHAFFVYSDLSRTPSLKIYFGILVLAGISSAIYRLISERYHLGRRVYAVAGVIKINDQVNEVELEPKDVKLKFLPGQFCFFKFQSQTVSSESHPFSIASSPKKENLKLVIKNSGDFTATIPRLMKGDVVFIEGPFGYFSCNKFPSQKQLWIAGGIGITPFLSMTESIEDNRSDIFLYYLVNNKKEAVSLDTLENIHSKVPGFVFRIHSSKDKGRISASQIKQQIPDLFEREIFICGPERMMSSLKKQFIDINIDKRRIHTEEFDFK